MTDRTPTSDPVARTRRRLRSWALSYPGSAFEGAWSDMFDELVAEFEEAIRQQARAALAALNDYDWERHYERADAPAGLQDAARESASHALFVGADGTITDPNNDGRVEPTVTLDYESVWYHQGWERGYATAKAEVASPEPASDGPWKCLVCGGAGSHAVSEGDHPGIPAHSFHPPETRLQREPESGEPVGPRYYGVPEPASPEAPPERLRGDGPCQDCGTLDNIVWFTDNVVWNAVCRNDQVFAEQKPAGILCIPCFVRRAENAGLWPTGWRLLPDWPWRETPAAMSAAASRIEEAMGETQAPLAGLGSIPRA